MLTISVDEDSDFTALSLEMHDFNKKTLLKLLEYEFQNLTNKQDKFFNRKVFLIGNIPSYMGIYLTLNINNYKPNNIYVKDTLDDDHKYIPILKINEKYELINYVPDKKEVVSLEMIPYNIIETTLLCYKVIGSKEEIWEAFVELTNNTTKFENGYVFKLEKPLRKVHDKPLSKNAQLLEISLDGLLSDRCCDYIYITD